MTETELIDRLREAIVLDGPDAWRSNGFLQDAQAVGLPLETALKRATEISQEVNNNSILFQNIQARIARLAQPSRSHLISQDLNQIVNAARSLNLSPDFVRNRWVPAELARLKAAATPPESPQPPTEITRPAPAVVATAPDRFDDLLDMDDEELPQAPATPLFDQPTVLYTPEPAPDKPPVFVPASVPELTFIRSEPTLPPSPAPVVRSFTATPARVFKGQNVTLSWEVENLLAVTIDELGEGLSPNNRGWIKPVKTADYTLFDANNNPLSTVRVEVIPRDRSGLYGVLFALVLLGLIYWFIKHTGSSAKIDRQPNKKTARISSQFENMPVRRDEPKPVEEVVVTPEPTVSVLESTVAESGPVAGLTPATTGSAKEEISSPASTRPLDDPKPEVRPLSKTAKPEYEESNGDKPYDKIDKRTDEQGWRMARKGTKWGYINQSDEWVIEPQFEATSPFKDNKAAVFLNGQLINISRDGQQVRE